MSWEPTSSYVSVRGLDLNSAAAHQAELEDFGEADKSDGDFVARDNLSGRNFVKQMNVNEVDDKEDNGASVYLGPKFADFSEEVWKNGDDATNPATITVDSGIDLKVKFGSPILNEVDKTDAKHLAADKNLEKKELFANDIDSDEVFNIEGSSGEVNESPNSEAGIKTLVEVNVCEYSDKMQLQKKEKQRQKWEFSVYDMVWGKVRSHPWWPGQIFHPSFASDMALKHQKKDHFLVAYFGDKTFAWNDNSHLKPFEKFFSHKDRQSILDDFIDSVDDALGEVLRCTELGMICGCIPDHFLTDLKCQMVDNAGIKEGTFRPILDRHLVVSSFDPSRLLDYIHALAQFPSGYFDKLSLVKVKAQLKVFYMSKGYSELPKFCFGGLSFNEDETSASKGEEAEQGDVEHTDDGILSNDIFSKENRRGRGRPPGKRKAIEEDSRKQKSLPELIKQLDGLPALNSKKSKDGVKTSLKTSIQKHMIDDPDWVDCVRSKKKRFKSLGNIGSMPAASSLESTSKTGQCINRVGGEIKNSSSVSEKNSVELYKGKSKENQRTSSVHGGSTTPISDAAFLQDYPASSEMLSQLCSAAKAPTKTHGFQSMAVGFFSNLRDSRVRDSLEDDKLINLVRSKMGQKKIAESGLVSVKVISDYFQDSYWPDAMIKGSPKKEASIGGRKRKAKSIMNQTKKSKAAVSSIVDHTLNSSEHVPYSSVQERRLVNSFDDKSIEECNPAELILSFSDPNALPSEPDLIITFSQYGPLKEAETKVSRKTRRASVLFKRGADAEVAFSSAGKFSAFGPKLVSYRIKYSNHSSSPKTTPRKDSSLTEGLTSEHPDIWPLSYC